MIEIHSIEDPNKPKPQQPLETTAQETPKTITEKAVFPQKSSYSLDSTLQKIKAKLPQKNTNQPQTPNPQTTNPQPETANTSSTPKSPTPKTPYNRTTERIWNFLQLVSTTAIIFSIAFVIMNWGAYQGILEKRWDDFWGLTDNSELVKIASDKQVAQELLPQSATLDQLKKEIPQIDMEIAPPDTRIIIPRINKNIPILPVSAKNLIRRDWSALERDIQEGLRSGVVHYPGTALPGENGNTVITGHSSYFPWDPGRFKDVFALLHDLRQGDRIVVYYDQKKFIYEVTSIKVVLPQQVEVLGQTGEEKLTLLTCTPIGTNLKRLIIEATPIQNL